MAIPEEGGVECQHAPFPLIESHVGTVYHFHKPMVLIRHYKILREVCISHISHIYRYAPEPIGVGRGFWKTTYGYNRSRHARQIGRID